MGGNDNESATASEFDGIALNEDVRKAAESLVDADGLGKSIGELLVTLDELSGEEDESRREELQQRSVEIAASNEGLTVIDRLLILVDKKDNSTSDRTLPPKFQDRLRQVLFDITLLTSMDDYGEVEQALVRYHNNRGAQATFRLTSRVIELGVLLNYLGTKNGLFELDNDETSRSDESETLNQLVEGAVRGISYQPDTPTLVDTDIDIEIERRPFDEDRLLRRLVHHDVTSGEFYTYVSRCDVSRLRNELIRRDESIQIVSSSGILRETLGPHDEVLISNIDNESYG
jgi:hypothetical protein